jgi:hypothetical protein
MVQICFWWLDEQYIIMSCLSAFQNVTMQTPAMRLDTQVSCLSHTNIVPHIRGYTYASPHDSRAGAVMTGIMIVGMTGSTRSFPPYFLKIGALPMAQMLSLPLRPGIVARSQQRIEFRRASHDIASAFACPHPVSSPPVTGCYLLQVWK